MTTIVVGWTPDEFGEAALARGLEEAKLRAGRVVVVNATRGDALVDQRYADDEQIGIWTLTRRGLERVDTGFPPGFEHQPCGQLEVRAGLLWSFGNFGVYVFDGKRWRLLPNPKVPT